VAQTVTKAVVNTVQKVVAAVQTAVKAVTTVVQSVAKAVTSTAKAVVSAAKATVSTAKSVVKSAVSTATQMVNQVKSTITAAVGGISSAVSSVANGAEDVYNTVAAAVLPTVSRYNSSKAVVRGTKLQTTSIDDEIVPLTNTLADGIKGNVGVAQMQQNLGTWWQVSYNNWMPINGNALDSISLNSYLYQKSLKTSPTRKDSVIGNAEISARNYTQKDWIKKDFEIKSSSIGAFNIQRFNLPIAVNGVSPSLLEYATVGADKGTGKNSEVTVGDVVKNTVINTVGGTADAIVGDAIAKLPSTTKSMTSIPALGVAAEVETITVNSGVKALKGVSKIAGPVAIAAYGYDVYQDVNKYDGTDAAKAVAVTTLATGLTVAAGVACTGVGAPVGAAIAVGVVVGVGTSILADKVKEWWIGY